MVRGRGVYPRTIIGAGFTTDFDLSSFIKTSKDDAQNPERTNIVYHKKTRTWRVFLRTYFSASANFYIRQLLSGQVGQNISISLQFTVYSLQLEHESLSGK